MAELNTNLRQTAKILPRWVAISETAELSPVPLAQIIYKANVDAAQEGVGRFLTREELDEVRTEVARPDEIETRDVARRLLGRELIRRDLGMIQDGVDPWQLTRVRGVARVSQTHIRRNAA